jgi:hypothetical protein
MYKTTTIIRSYTSAMAQQGKCFEFQFVLILSEYFARHNSQHEKRGELDTNKKGNLTRKKKKKNKTGLDLFKTNE